MKMTINRCATIYRLFLCGLSFGWSFYSRVSYRPLPFSPYYWLSEKGGENNPRRRPAHIIFSCSRLAEVLFYFVFFLLPLLFFSSWSLFRLIFIKRKEGKRKKTKRKIRAREKPRRRNIARALSSYFLFLSTAKLKQKTQLTDGNRFLVQRSGKTDQESIRQTSFVERIGKKKVPKRKEHDGKSWLVFPRRVNKKKVLAERRPAARRYGHLFIFFGGHIVWQRFTAVFPWP